MVKRTLEEANPYLANQWHPTKNGDLTPRDVTPQSNKKRWWMCNKGHEWQASIYNRSNGTGCPFCSGNKVFNNNCLATLNPNLAKQWHPTNNLPLTPMNVTTGSHKKVWWICNKGHEWQAVVKERHYGTGCPFCSGNTVCDDNCLSALNPEVAKQWHPTHNGSLTPRDITPHSSKKVWWLCDKGHEWQAIISSRSAGKGCPKCSGRTACDENCLAKLNLAFVNQWHPTKNGDLTPRDVTPHSNKKVWWICNKGHEWQAIVNSRSMGSGCPKCYSQISQLELRIYCELKYLFLSSVSKEKIFGNECDVYIPEIKAGVEVDGLYWHLDRDVQDNKKADAIRSAGITLIRVREIGLKTTSDTDIFYTPKDDALTVIKKIVTTLKNQCSLSCNKKRAIDEYIQKQTFANDSEYKKLWDMLPSPFPGLSLAEQNPELIKDWHKDKNGTLTPKDVSLFSSKKIWWMCNKGHEWQAVVSHRSNGSGCPYCSGNAVCNDNCLSTLNPNLAKQWHPTNNLPLTPMSITMGSSKKIWWICDNGHEWQALIVDRNNGTGCPYCSGRAVCSDNCLSTLNPNLAKQWHPTKNLPLTPMSVTMGSSKKIWWICDKGHEWQVTVNSRSTGKGCPFCSGKAVYVDNCLATLNPNLAKQWHPTKNLPLTPMNVTIGSNKKVWWTCDKGHEWQAIIYSRSIGQGCPYCSGKSACSDNCLATLNPNLAKQWHPTKNLPLTPMNVTTGSNKKVWWICDKGHEWQAIVKSRSKGIGCPFCSRRRACNENSLYTIHPILSKEWHPTKNGDLTPRDVTPQSNKKRWWMCNKGHEWQASIYNRSNGTGCPFCQKNKIKPQGSFF